MLVLAAADVLLLAVAGALAQFARRLTCLCPELPAHPTPRRCTVTLGPVGQLTAWVEYAIRRGPPAPGLATA